ncbi:MAG: hydantoinase B/oxoprolinase family protein [Candidatus Competibacteraceae bacterium]
MQIVRKLHLRYEGSDTALLVDCGDRDNIIARFETAHRSRYGFLMPGKGHIVEAVSVELIGAAAGVTDLTVELSPRDRPLQAVTQVAMVSGGVSHSTPVYRREELRAQDRIAGPAIIIEAGATTVVEPGWQAEVTDLNHLVLTRIVPLPPRVAVGTQVDPILLEVFNNLFMSIAEQMGVTLANTAHSVVSTNRGSWITLRKLRSIQATPAMLTLNSYGLCGLHKRFSATNLTQHIRTLLSNLKQCFRRTGRLPPSLLPIL